ncbi:actin-depolymerizing factor-like [Raphidocelis subcapitata]|uniref:Actin-depolymerizing factor-like n=1 Tax=Raphidocelis subcapitata TaxID=307507 RepID=A0A2V0PBP2_9CHLO|nr:actin-depolymerizing factor-like [Raphidocelis subcapitata]|eukprot:GBF94587.1 actin-depolymerizing factor-like [Raphidocelis subcapitata]
MADLETLRAARAAIEEGLISSNDYDVVKVAFLRAQQIKAGFDAGFLPENDYQRARDAYLNALDFSVMAARPSVGGPVLANANGAPAPRPAANGAAAAAATAARAAAPAPAAARARAPTAAASPGVGNGSPANGASAAAAAAVSPSGTGGGGAPSPRGQPAGSSGAGSGGGGGGSGGGDLRSPTRAGGSGGAMGLFNRAFGRGSGGGGGPPSPPFAMPRDVPAYVARGWTARKVSMAGIGLTDDCVNLFMHMKTRSAFKWIVFRVDDSGKTVVPERMGGRGSAYDEFVASLPPRECRYGVFDYEYTSRERGSFNKIVFINWAPETAHIKTKMMYAATKDFFKGFLEGTGAELQANDADDISEDEMRARVMGNLTRK